VPTLDCGLKKNCFQKEIMALLITSESDKQSAEKISSAALFFKDTVQEV